MVRNASAKRVICGSTPLADSSNGDQANLVEARLWKSRGCGS